MERLGRDLAQGFLALLFLELRVFFHRNYGAEQEWKGFVKIDDFCGLKVEEYFGDCVIERIS